MATTRIMPLHTGKGHTESRAISAIIDYVANPEKTDHGRLITGYKCNSRLADAEFMLAKRQYLSRTGRFRGKDDVVAYHVRRSFRPGEITPEEVNRLGTYFYINSIMFFSWLKNHRAKRKIHGYQGAFPFIMSY